MVIHQNRTSIKVRNEENVIEPHNMLNMIILKTSPNYSKSLILGSGDSFPSNFTIFEKNNSNCSTLGAANQKSHKDVPVLAPVMSF